MGGDHRGELNKPQEIICDGVGVYGMEVLNKRCNTSWVDAILFTALLVDKMCSVNYKNKKPH